VHTLSADTVFAYGDSIAYFEAVGGNNVRTMPLPTRSYVSSIVKLGTCGIEVTLSNGFGFNTGLHSCVECYKPQFTSQLLPLTHWGFAVDPPMRGPPLPGGVDEEWDMYLPHPHFVFQRGDPIQYYPQMHSARYGYDKENTVFGTIETIHKSDASNITVRMVGGDTLFVGSDYNAAMALAKGDQGKPYATMFALANYYGWQMTPAKEMEASTLKRKAESVTQLRRLEDKVLAEVADTGMNGFIRSSNSTSGMRCSDVTPSACPIGAIPVEKYLYCNNVTRQWTWAAANSVMDDNDNVSGLNEPMVLSYSTHYASSFFHIRILFTLYLYCLSYVTQSHWTCSHSIGILCTSCLM
jgi:hypothetical protein